MSLPAKRFDDITDRERYMIYEAVRRIMLQEIPLENVQGLLTRYQELIDRIEKYVPSERDHLDSVILVALGYEVSRRITQLRRLPGEVDGSGG